LEIRELTLALSSSCISEAMVFPYKMSGAVIILHYSVYGPRV